MGINPNDHEVWKTYLINIARSLEYSGVIEEHHRIIEILLKHGADPNMKSSGIQGIPVWGEFGIISTSKVARRLKSPRNDDRNHILSLLFHSGANPYMGIDSTLRSHTQWT
jgi:hypothetical protein